jgi:hypothetical protein
MSKLIIFDTDILIDAGRDDKKAVARLESEEAKNALSISIITKMELIVGCRNKSEQRILENFLKRFEVIYLTESISKKATDLLKTYRLSHGLLIPDALIAATAILSHSPFVSKNQKDFQYIEGLNLFAY